MEELDDDVSTPLFRGIGGSEGGGEGATTQRSH